MRAFNDWELDEFQQYIELTSSKKIAIHLANKLKCDGNFLGGFTVKAPTMQISRPSPFISLLNFHGIELCPLR